MTNIVKGIRRILGCKPIHGEDCDCDLIGDVEKITLVRTMEFDNKKPLPSFERLIQICVQCLDTDIYRYCIYGTTSNKMKNNNKRHYVVVSRNDKHFTMYDGYHGTDVLVVESEVLLRKLTIEKEK